jgi:hypothetical protein
VTNENGVWGNGFWRAARVGVAAEIKRFNTEGTEERRRKIGERQRRGPQRRRGRREKLEKRRATFDETEPAATNSEVISKANSKANSKAPT